LYRCRGGLPGSVVSQDVSSSLRSAIRMRIGYRVPDFRLVSRLMSYPYFQSFGASRKASSTWRVCGDSRSGDTMTTLYICRGADVKPSEDFSSPVRLRRNGNELLSEESGLIFVGSLTIRGSQRPMYGGSARRTEPQESSGGVRRLGAIPASFQAVRRRFTLSRLRAKRIPCDLYCEVQAKHCRRERFR
jgi:hypothetical protein